MTKKEKAKKGTIEEQNTTETQNDSENLKETLQRVQADFENYRKQTEKRIEDINKRASRDVILKLLPIIDDFELALKHDELSEGMKAIYTKLLATLEAEGVKVIESMGEMFNPYKHEALLKKESDKEENTIIEELQKGYTINEETLREAKVIVSAGKQNTNQTEEEK